MLGFYFHQAEKPPRNGFNFSRWRDRHTSLSVVLRIHKHRFIALWRPKARQRFLYGVMIERQFVCKPNL